MLKNSFMMSFFLILSSMLGFIAQILFARTFGASSEMDIYFKLLSVPAIITGLVSVVFTSVLLPIFAKFEEDERKLKHYFNSLWVYVLLFSIIFSVAGCLLTIYRLNNVNEMSETLKNTAIKVSVIVWAGSGFFIISSYFSAVLNFYKQFFKLAWTAMLPTSFMILFVLLFHKHIGILSIALGSLMAYIIQFMIFFKANKSYYSMSNLLFKRIPNYRQLLYQSFLVVLSLLPFTVFVPIGYLCASTLKEGSVSYLGYSQSFSAFLSVATSMGAAIVSFPNLVNDFAKGNIDSSLFKFEITLKYVLLISIFFASAFISIRVPILTLFYRRGNFTQDSVMMLADVIPWYLFSAVFISGLNLLRTLFYTKGEFKSIAILGVGIPIFYYFSANFLKNYFSIIGIGIANTISFFILFCLSIYLLQSKHKNFLKIEIMFFIVKNIIVALISYMFILYLFTWLLNFINPISSIMICLILFTLIYYILSRYIIKITEVYDIEKIVIIKIKSIRK
jgi:putative peptidoglycan lipid II flippase